MNATGPMASDDALRFRLLYDLGCAFAARIELAELLPLVLDKCRSALDADGVAVMLHDPERGELEFSYHAGDAEVAARLVTLRVPADRGIAGAVLQTGRPLRVDDPQSDPRFFPEIDRLTGQVTRSILCVPLTSRGGRIGVLQVVNRHGDGGVFGDEDLSFLDALAGSIAVAIENARLYARVKAEEERLRTQVGALRRDLERRDRFTEIIGTGPAMRQVFRLMESAAASPISVLISGETGTGKELVARGIHRASSRAEGPFIPINCAAFPETLLESELFGHRRGAFTGATQDKRGLFEAASGGTLFLDEVGEMPAAMQAKLLRVLQEGEVLAIGDTRSRSVDVRVVAATNRDLRAEIANRTFREDLYYRVAAFPIPLPPLRERRDDIPVIVDGLLRRAAERHAKRIDGIEPWALECITAFDWPGNVRELENEIERAVALANDGDVIGPEHLSEKLAPTVATPAAETMPVGGETRAVSEAPGATGTRHPDDGTEAVDASLRRARAAFETRHIAEVLRANGGQVTRSARALGISRVMLQKKMKDLRLR